MSKRLVCIVLPICLLLLAACSAAPTATPFPTDEPYPTPTPTVRPTEGPKATQVPEVQTSTGNPALDEIISSNLPSGGYEFSVVYTPKTADAGAQLEIFYPITDFWTLLGMIKAGYTTFYAEAPLLFEADPDLEFATFIFQKPADSEKQEVGPQPVIIMGVSRENVAKVNSNTRWCDLIKVIDRLEFSDEGGQSWTDFCRQ
ncbi:MAG: hypothetical protein ACYC6L_06415 [Anaerolineae bacterium]